MTNTKSEFKVFMSNLFDFILFGIKLYKSGVCDNRIDGEYKLIDPSNIKGYNKIDAAKKLGISTRQFDRKIKNGLIKSGKKYIGDTQLYWSKAYIDTLSI